MSMTLTIELSESGFQRDPEFPDSYFNAGALPYISYELDKLIEGTEILPLSEYTYSGDMLTEEEWADMAQKPPEKQWFAAEDGLNTVDHMINLLKSRDPKEQLESCTVEDALYELNLVRTILNHARERGERFSFDVG